MATLRFHYDSVDSTNEQALRLSLEHPGRELLVTADVQSAGRGRSGRSWASPLGGLWMSLSWPLTLADERYEALPLVAALALRQAVLSLIHTRKIAKVSESDVVVKWPNDLLIRGRKAAGILCERHLTPQQGHASVRVPGSAIIGIGVNCDFAATQLPADVRYPTTTLRDELNTVVDPSELLKLLTDRLAVNLRRLERDGFALGLKQELLLCLAFKGHRIQLGLGDRTTGGILEGLDDRGRLLLRGDKGLEAFESGEVLRTDRSGR